MALHHTSYKAEWFTLDAAYLYFLEATDSKRNISSATVYCIMEHFKTHINLKAIGFTPHVSVCKGMQKT